MIMDPSRTDIISEILTKGFLQLIEINANEGSQIQEIYEIVEDIESDETEKIIQLTNKYRANNYDEIEIYKEVVEILGKLILNYEAHAELSKSIREELSELKSKFDSEKME